MTTPATGSAALIGFTREPFPGIRDTAATVHYVRPALPANSRFGFAKNPAAEVNQSGFVEQGTPGAITGPIDFGCRFSVQTLFFLLTHFFRDITKSTLESGVFQYVCELDRTLAERTLSLLYGIPPVDQLWQHNMLIGQLVANIGANTEVVARVTGQALHFTRLGSAVADAGNTGTWAYAPVCRGPLASEAAGNVFLEVTDLAPLKFKLKQATGTTPPTMSGSTKITQLYGPDGNAIYVNGLADTGAEIGIFDENKDPFMVCVPGTAVQHADIDVGDVFYFPAPGEWDLPASPTYLAGQRFLSAHQLNQYSTDNGSNWVDFNTQTSVLTVADPIAADNGSGSRYGFGLDRSGLQFNPTIQVAQKERSRAFRTLYELNEVVKLRTYFQGQLLAGGPYRESLLLDWNAAQITALAAPVSGPASVIETTTFQGVTDDSGNAPLTVTLISDQDYATT